MASDLRFAGQEGQFVLVNATTGDRKLSQVPVKSWRANFPFDLVQREYMGDIAPVYREFADGATLEVELDWASADQASDYMNAMVAKAQGLSNDEFQCAIKHASPSGGTFRVIFRDIHSEGIPFESSGRKDFASGKLSFKCSKFKIESV